MTLIRYEPWTLMNRLSRELDQAFGEAFGAPAAASDRTVAWVPAVDVHEEGNRFVVRADVPGVEPKDIEVTADNGILTVRGERRFEKRANVEGFERLERVEGTFLRRFTLPDSVETDKILARFSNGVLEITIPKSPQLEPKRIAVESH
jgi:HSP20 family protein